uniref:Uncharacterized protein n=1 Tax=Rhizophagus irregularis (strain DAOM 181602 / DAOM 197198 / MUCL 43194) TaxID=747089 RepID=U9TVL1_RHIID
MEPSVPLVKFVKKIVISRNPLYRGTLLMFRYIKVPVYRISLCTYSALYLYIIKLICKIQLVHTFQHFI